VSPDGIIRTVAGAGDPDFYGSSGDGGPATSARVPHPSALAVSAMY
jgi:hypothetical protein